VQTHDIQLLHACWYSATTTNPWTAATFRLLDHFQMYTFESKGSTFEYYQSLLHLTNNTETHQPKVLSYFYAVVGILTDIQDHYESFLRMSHQHRHLTSLLQAGQGHNPSGVLSTKEGELTIICPPCPQPGRNLPQDWENVPRNVKYVSCSHLSIQHSYLHCDRWLYGLFVAIDANFRLCRCNKSSDQVDPGLSSGWSYFVEHTQFKEVLDVSSG
jgi:hypothetical protein